MTGYTVIRVGTLAPPLDLPTIAFARRDDRPPVGELLGALRRAPRGEMPS